MSIFNPKLTFSSIYKISIIPDIVRCGEEMTERLDESLKETDLSHISRHASDISRIAFDVVEGILSDNIRARLRSRCYITSDTSINILLSIPGCLAISVGIKPQ